MKLTPREVAVLAKQPDISEVDKLNASNQGITEVSGQCANYLHARVPCRASSKQSALTLFALHPLSLTKLCRSLAWRHAKHS